MNGAAPPRPIHVGLVWAALTTASLAGFALAEGQAAARVAATLAVVLAAAKIHLVIAHYMELTWAHQPLRGLLAVWLAFVSLTLLAGCWTV